VALLHASVSSASPIGVFDSGVGGLSVLRALQAELPHERFVYVADAGFAPYGERDDAHVIARSHTIGDYLQTHHHIKALVVACNTATAAAIAQLRSATPALPIVGIEPALKPAAALSKTKVVGVMATRGTLNSEKFATLLASLHGQATFVLQPCDGLADAIEHADATKIIAACARYTEAMGRFGIESGEMDTLVLGCTHYPFVATELTQLVGKEIILLEGGAPVARRTRTLLEKNGLLTPPTPSIENQSQKTTFFTTGAPDLLSFALLQWLHTTASVETIRS
jgi:glutamate racemase